VVFLQLFSTISCIFVDYFWGQQVLF